MIAPFPLVTKFSNEILGIFIWENLNENPFHLFSYVGLLATTYFNSLKFIHS